MEDRQKRERDVDAKLASRRALKEQKAENALVAESQQYEDELDELDPFGISMARDALRVHAEEAAVDLEERQYRNAQEAQRRMDEGNRRAAAVWRRQDAAELRRRNVLRMLRNQLGREPTHAEFIAGVAHLRIDPNWSDDEG